MYIPMSIRLKKVPHGNLSKMNENTSEKQVMLHKVCTQQIDNQKEFFFRCRSKARDFFNYQDILNSGFYLSWDFHPSQSRDLLITGFSRGKSLRHQKECFKREMKVQKYNFFVVLNYLKQRVGSLNYFKCLIQMYNVM